MSLLFLRSIIVFCLSLHVLSLTSLSDANLNRLPDPGADFEIDNKEGLLAPILRPRVPGTPASLEVLQHFLDFFHKTLPEWRVELHNSSSTTPATGSRLIPFVNLIATRDPPWAREGHVGRLALTAHYDSKISPEGFIGAIDSAAPCAMIMHVARSIDAALTRKWADMAAERDDLDDDGEEKGVQIILFDGEEAFVSWTSTDSIYGARALAEHWETQQHPVMSTYHNPIASINLFLLLDLLGSKNPRIPSYFATTHWAYRAMAKLETRLRDGGLFLSEKGDSVWLQEADRENFAAAYMGDDHVPFLARGVQVLHMIPSPFPEVWHLMTDDAEHLDMPTVKDWAKLVLAFTVEWLDLEDYLFPSTKSKSVLEDKTEFV